MTDPIQNWGMALMTRQIELCLHPGDCKKLSHPAELNNACVSALKVNSSRQVFVFLCWFEIM